MCVGAKNQLSIPRAPCYTPLMYRLFANGPRATIEAAWDILAWSDPTPADAVDAKEDGRKGWTLDAYARDEDAAKACIALVAGVAPDLNVRYEVLEERDWVTHSLEGLPPVEAGPFIVAGSHALTESSPGKIGVLIEAGPAFGTGHHGTTLGCLLGLEHIMRHRRVRKVLDLGTGSGVLSIAALKVGAQRAIGTDIDADSIRVANENAAKNNVASQFQGAVCSGSHHTLVQSAAPYDTVFANILARPLVRLAPEIHRMTAPGGNIILSGLLRHQEPQVIGAFKGRGLSLITRFHRDGWSTLLFRKPASAKRSANSIRRKRKFGKTPVTR